MNGWLILAVIFYPIAASPYFTHRTDRFIAFAIALIVFLVLWLGVLPRDLAWNLGPVVWQSRFVLPLTAYLCGLAVAAVLVLMPKPTS